MYETSEPIYALATPLMPSALAVTRVSGMDSLRLLTSIFSRDISDKPTNSAIHGFLYDTYKNLIDEVVIVVYRAGHGYTSEEAAEIMTHGSIEVIRRLAMALEEIGFRLAHPGEFTYRAFMNGKMDLTEAEAVEEIVSARGERALDEALERLTGSLKRELSILKDDLLGIIASLEVYLDYGEDEIAEDWVFPEAKVKEIKERIKRMLLSYRAGRLYKRGVKVVITGDVNAGKSSLFNALLGSERSIVSPLEGTTRDYIESEVEIDGIPLRLFDTAGLRETESEVEMSGIERTKELLRSADIIIELRDDDEEALSDERKIVVRSKSDIRGKRGELSLSSVTGEGIDILLDEIRRRLESVLPISSEGPRIQSERQKEGLEKALLALEDAERDNNMSVDILSLHFEEALRSLRTLLGEVTNDEILERLFSDFCLGK